MTLLGKVILFQGLLFEKSDKHGNLFFMLNGLYNILNRESNQRIIQGIDATIVSAIPKNYFLIIISNICTQLGDVLSAPKTVITWLLGYLGAPIFLISLLVPIRESGSMLPQVFLSNILHKVLIRKKWWIVGSLVQSFSLVGIIITAIFSTGTIAGIIIVGLVGIFSIGRALCSLLSKDVIGKTIPKTRRGKLNGYASSFSGVLVLISGIVILFHPIENAAMPVLLTLIASAALLWFIAAFIFSYVKEPASTNKSKSTSSFMHLLGNDVVLQKFILARGLLISSALMSPFIILLSQKYIGTDIYLLGLFILAGGLASIISGPFWGHMADVSSKKVMIKSASIVAVVSIIVSVLLIINSSLVLQLWLYPALLFVLGIAHDGIRLGRKTYIIDIAEGNLRTQYVAASNTAIGILLLFVGIFTAWLGSLSLVLAIGVLTVMVLLGIWFSWMLPEALEE